MDIKIEQLRTSSTVKNLLTRIKGITSIQNWNVLCRWGFCFSIKQSTLPRMVDEKLDGVEIDYDVLVTIVQNLVYPVFLKGVYIFLFFLLR